MHALINTSLKIMFCQTNVKFGLTILFNLYFSAEYSVLLQAMPSGGQLLHLIKLYVGAKGEIILFERRLAM